MVQASDLAASCADLGAAELVDPIERTYHVIPVPRGWSVEQAWEAISRGDLQTDPDPDWGTVIVENGRMVGLVEMEADRG